MAKTAGDNETLVDIVVKVPRELLEKINATARALGNTRSAHLRAVLSGVYAKGDAE